MEDSNKKSKARESKEKYAISLIKKLNELSNKIENLNITRGSK